MDFPSFSLSSILLFFTVIICLLHHFFVELQRKKKLPPGPFSLPLVGNLFNIGSKPHKSLAMLAKKHGPLMTIRLGCVTTVVASSPEMAREILQKKDEAFSGRTIPHAVTAQNNYDVSVLWISVGNQWRILRRALSIYLTNPQKLNAIRDLRYKAVEEMVQYVKGQAVVDIGKLAFTTALNQMSNTCFSENVADFEAGNVQGFQTVVKTIMEVDGKFNIADIFPWLKPWDPQGLRRKAKAAYGWLHKVAEDFIDQRLEHRRSGFARFGDLLDSLMDYSQENESLFNRIHIKILLVDLFLAGTETNSNTTEWAMTELLLHPPIMSKLRQEITEDVRLKGKIEESEILQLPYLQAVLKETLRLHLSVPLLIPHKTERDVNMHGYTIPKNTQVLVNAWTIARDDEYWENPTEFKPERFLGSEIDFRGQHFSFIPFGSGRRMCSGILLAQRVVSLMLASLVYEFEWELPHGMSPEKMDMDDIFGITLVRATPLLAVPTTRRNY